MKKLISSVKNWNLLKLHTCSLRIVDSTHNSGSKSQLRTLYVKTTNVISLYVNNVKVSPMNCMKVAPLEDKNYIEVKAVGLFKTKIVKLEVPNIRIKTAPKPFSKRKSLTLESKLNTIYRPKSYKIKSQITVLKSEKTVKLSLKQSYKLQPNNQTLNIIKTLYYGNTNLSTT